MKKRIVIFLLMAAVSVPLTACATAQKDRLMTLVDCTLHYSVYVHDETGVMCFNTAGGGTCVMVDVDGRPLIYEKSK